MEKTMKDYAAFERAMDEEKLYLDMDYKAICSRIGADPDGLDRVLIAELGSSGRELVDFY